ncbi:MAG TPA: ATP-binding cassette domain-containing protein, partial [Caulobacteraceae bacterium]|nr:ATP-binding cassette domain-containing protein [Caulobacteraceae bacterium]
MSSAAEDNELDETAPPIEVIGLVSRYDDHLIHDGLDLRVKHGEVLGVVGGSGAGKTVLLNTLIGLKVPDGGVVKIFGQDLDRASNAKWDAIERSWGVLFQQGALFSNLTVKENVAAPMQEHTRLPDSVISELAELK